MNSNALVIGGTGLLGNALVRLNPFGSALLATYHRQSFSFFDCQWHSLDSQMELQVESFFQKNNPPLVINTVASTNVDWCEQNEKEAYLLNVESARLVAEACEKNGSRLVYISTDHVFDGKKGNYSELDDPHPVNVYAKQKLEAEKVSQKHCSNTLVLRTNLYGWNVQPKKESVEWAISQYRLGLPFNGFTDAIFTPLWSDELATAIWNLAQQDVKGIYHLGCEKALSKFDFMQQVGQTFGFDPQLVKPVSMDSMNFKAPRPKNLSLDSRKVFKLLGKPLPNPNESLPKLQKMQQKSVRPF